MSRHVTQTIGKAVSTFAAIGIPRTVEEAARLDDGASSDRFAGNQRSRGVGDGFGLTLAALAVVLIVVLLVAMTLFV